MLFVNQSKINIFWGDVSNCLVSSKNYQAFYKEALNKLKKFRLQGLFYPQQEHTAQGYAINKNADGVCLFDQVGDFLITNNRLQGIAVLTADCLPIVMYDPVYNAIGVAHAGWKGTAANIATSMLKKLGMVYGSNPADVQVWFGPSARACCYEVQPDFLTHFQQDLIDQNILQQRGE